MVPLFLFFLMTFSFSPSLLAEALVVQKREGPEVRWELVDILRKIPSQEIPVSEPHSDKKVTYVGIPFAKFLSLPEIYGETWKEHDTILFTCKDGFQPAIPVEKFKRHESFLVHKIKGDVPFVVDNIGQNEKSVPLGPYYLIWENLKSSEMRESGNIFWPYQVVKIELVKFVEKYPNLIPAQDSSLQVQNGFKSYKLYCLTCHSLKGEGGGKGPDLKDALGKYGEKWVAQFISDPRSLRKESKMKRLESHIKDRDQVIADILAYLKQKTLLPQTKKPGTRSRHR